MSDATVKELAAESEHVRARREDLVKETAKLREALKYCNRYKPRISLCEYSIPSLSEGSRLTFGLSQPRWTAQLKSQQRGRRRLLSLNATPRCQERMILRRVLLPSSRAIALLGRRRLHQLLQVPSSAGRSRIQPRAALLPTHNVLPRCLPALAQKQPTRNRRPHHPPSRPFFLPRSQMARRPTRDPPRRVYSIMHRRLSHQTGPSFECRRRGGPHHRFRVAILARAPSSTEEPNGTGGSRICFPHGPRL